MSWNILKIGRNGLRKSTPKYFGLLKEKPQFIQNQKIITGLPKAPLCYSLFKIILNTDFKRDVGSPEKK